MGLCRLRHQPCIGHHCPPLDKRSSAGFCPLDTYQCVVGGLVLFLAPTAALTGESVQRLMEPASFAGRMFSGDYCTFMNDRASSLRFLLCPELRADRALFSSFTRIPGLVQCSSQDVVRLGIIGREGNCLPQWLEG